MKRTVSALALLFATAVPGAGEEAAPGYVRRGKDAVVKAAAVNEASGAAASRRADGLLWVVNDSDCTAELHLVGTDGSDRGSVLVEGVRNRDWEDLASYVSGGVPRLLIADTGDNLGQWRQSSLLIVREPALPAEGQRLKGKVKVERRINFRFEGGPRDCEAVAVDVPGRRILLVTKRTIPPELHELPLHPEKPGQLQTTRRIGAVTIPRPPLPVPLMTQPTGLDITADGRRAVLLTYLGVFLYERGDGQSWQDAMAAAPLPLGAHLLPQAEAIAFSRDASSIRVLSEGVNLPMTLYERKQR